MSERTGQSGAAGGSGGVAGGGASARGARPPVIAVTMGDPLGIGPETIVKALADRVLRRAARYRVYGMAGVMAEAASRAGIEPYWWRVARGSPVAETAFHQDVAVLDYPEYEPSLAAEAAPGPTRAGGAASLRFVEDAVGAARLPAQDPWHADAIVTAPISKTSWDLAGHGPRSPGGFPGHTELLAARFHAKRVGMLFAGPSLRVMLATIHVPLMDLRNVLTIGKVFDAIDLGHEACRGLGVSHPRIAVCGLNPHAGEGGLLGDEDERLIRPAVDLAASQGMEVSGPWPADTIFAAAAAPPHGRGRYDLVVAMYHDQGLIPVKLLDGHRAVNVTVGLPTVRTSPAHGTAFDIAGRNAADAGGMRAALEAAVGMAKRRAGAPAG
jgi:4-hydroxythreonine-4-phosphate dehydrogenase